MKYSHLGALKGVNRRLQKVGDHTFDRLLLTLCQDYQHYPFVSDLAGLVQAKSYNELVELADSLSSQKYDDATQHFVANQFSALIRKYPFSAGQTSFDPEKKAYETFLKSEHKCKRINQRFRARRESLRMHPYEAQIDLMRKFIRYVLSDEPPYEEIFAGCGFGPGASIGVHGNATNFSRKLLARPWSVSSFAFDFAYNAVMKHAQFREVFLPEHGGFSDGKSDQSDVKALFRSRCKIVNHNNILFVLKTVKTHRSIAVEPLLNGFLQKGVDLAYRRRLLRVGIDLSAQEPNCEMARQGSFDSDDGFVTIDLRGASDGNALEVVRETHPPSWFYLLDRLRSHEFEYDGVTKTFEKFCSMGNGFCFPLESLIFTAACAAVTSGKPGVDFRVYGDDIIVRKRFAKPLLALLGYLGFSVNKDKTFLEGPFRESCGSDWFSGEDVRPFTLDFRLDSVQNVFKFLNLSRRSDRTSGFFSGVRSMLLRLIPSRLQFWRPYSGNADSAIDTTGDEHLSSRNCLFDRKNRLWRWKELSVVPIQDIFWLVHTGKGGEAALVYGAYSGSASACPFSMRNTTRTKVRLTSHPGATSTWLPAISTYRYGYHFLAPDISDLRSQ